MCSDCPAGEKIKISRSGLAAHSETKPRNPKGELSFLSKYEKWCSLYLSSIGFSLKSCSLEFTHRKSNRRHRRAGLTGLIFELSRHWMGLWKNWWDPGFGHISSLCHLQNRPWLRHWHPNNQAVPVTTTLPVLRETYNSQDHRGSKWVFSSTYRLGR